MAEAEARFELMVTCASTRPAAGDDGWPCIRVPARRPEWIWFDEYESDPARIQPPAFFLPSMPWGDLHQRAACTVHRTATQHKGRKRGRESAHDPAGVNAAAAPPVRLRRGHSTSTATRPGPTRGAELDAL